MPAPREAGAFISERYRIESVLGEGGMAWVYAAKDEYLNRLVAFKELRPQMASMSARFEREARVAGALQHPAVVKVFGYGQSDQGAYIVFEFVEGETLAELLKRTGPLPVGRVASLLRPVVGALAEAHDAGVIHRDLKPENLIVQRGAGLEEHVRLLDFGIAAVSDAEERLTREGEVFGTPHFMSPQQIKGEAVTATADVWAVGVIMYNMITGKLPFKGPHAASILFKVVNVPAPPLPEGLDSRFAALINRCLDKDPEERFTDARALLQELESFTPAAPWVVERPPKASTSKPAVDAMDVTPTQLLKTQVFALREMEPRWLLPALGGLCATLGLLMGLLFGGGGADGDEASPPEAPISSSEAPQAKPAGPKASKPKVTAALSEAEALLKRKDMERLQAWLKLNPEVGSPAARARLEGLVALQEGEPEEGISQLASALRLDPSLKTDPAILEAAFEALMDYKGKAAETLLGGPLFNPEVEARLHLLTSDSKNYIRWRAVEAIKLGGGDIARAEYPAYLLNLKADSCDLRRRAAVKLGELGNPEAIPALKQMVKSTGFFDRRCIGASGTKAIKKLKEIEEARLSDSDAEAR